MPELTASAHRVQAALDAEGIGLAVVQLPDSTRSAAEAAAAIGCEVAHIAKSLVFRGERSGAPVLVIASGANRVDENAVAERIGEPVGKADADYVREQTGFSIGGVPPVGHLSRLRTLIDVDLLSLAEIWAAAGTPNAVFKLNPSQLMQLTGGEVVAINAG
jgi:prolyl-tRNA editing enzyme YbaK/EbsC (Cys-tRNA(Pro) deacylase)